MVHVKHLKQDIPLKTEQELIISGLFALLITINLLQAKMMVLSHVLLVLEIIGTLMDRLLPEHHKHAFVTLDTYLQQLIHL